MSLDLACPDCDQSGPCPRHERTQDGVKHDQVLTRLEDMATRLDQIDDRLEAIERGVAHEKRATENAIHAIWLQTVAAVVFEDLRGDFEDGQNILLRWRGNLRDWNSIRELQAYAQGRIDETDTAQVTITKEKA